MKWLGNLTSQTPALVNQVEALNLLLMCRRGIVLMSVFPDHTHILSFFIIVQCPCPVSEIGLEKAGQTPALLSQVETFVC